ncbi:MAG TPA: PHP domain-containing protein, partial [bacterium]|nr:PHP domain-containing protein [bacterium]
MDTADLHMHSVRSDGEWSPARVVKEAGREGLRAVALTDHDTTEGLDEAFAAGAEHGVEVIAGVEISTWLDSDVHVLAYGFDPRDAALTALFLAARGARRERAERMVERLAELGNPISMESVLREAGDGAIGRPHVARALAKSGQVGSVREAFDRFLGDGKPACVDKMKVTPEEAARAVREAGGVTVAAHPGCYGGTALLERLADAGVDGVE